MLAGTREADGAYQEDETIDVEALAREAAGWDRHLEFARFQVLLSLITLTLTFELTAMLMLMIHLYMIHMSYMIRITPCDPAQKCVRSLGGI